MPRRQPSKKDSAKPTPEQLAKLYESNGKLAKFHADEEEELSGLPPEKAIRPSESRSPRD